MKNKQLPPRGTQVAMALATTLVAATTQGQESRQPDVIVEPPAIAPDARETFNEMDKDGDGKITLDEFGFPDRGFKQLDRDQSGTITLEELNAMWLHGAARKDDAPQVGDTAPTFTLKSLDGKEEFDLADFRERKPVLLLFGSYT